MSLFFYVLAVCLVCTASASSLRFKKTSSLRDEQWELFKTTHKKTYESQEHEALRRIIFEVNMNYVQRHNFEADLGRHSYRLGMNQYADLTNAEFRKLLLGFRFNASRSREGSTFLPPSNVVLPRAVDWRTKGYVTPVKNQGQCGSCWAFSTTGSLEGQHFRKTGKLVSLSEQNLVDCSTRFGNNGCNGGLMDNAFKYIKANGGIDTEKSYPYLAHGARCHFKKRDVGATDSGFVDVEQGDEDALKKASATVGPISVAIDASHQSFQLYESGVYTEPDCSPDQLDHGVLVVGYGSTENDEDYWIVKNSWGPQWGMNGYIMMARNRDNMCGIASSASYPLV